MKKPDGSWNWLVILGLLCLIDVGTRGITGFNGDAGIFSLGIGIGASYVLGSDIGGFIIAFLGGIIAPLAFIPLLLIGWRQNKKKKSDTETELKS